MRRKMSAGLLFVALWLGLPGAADAGPRPAKVPYQDKGRNSALGRKVGFMPPPTYGPTARGETDATDLTDGALVDPDRKLRFDNRAVGWSNATVVRALVDLGRPRDIGNVAVHCQGGGADKRFCLRAPRSIRVFVSDDGRDFADAGAFVKTRAFEQGLIPAETGTLWKWWFLVPANVRARYVLVSVQVQSYPMTMDEIAVLTPEDGAKVTTPKAWPLVGYGGSGLTVYAHKELSVIPTDFFFYENFGQFCGFGEATTATLEIDVPDWIEIGAAIGASVEYDFTRGKLHAGDKRPRLIREGDRRILRFAPAPFDTSVTSRSHLRLFWRARTEADGWRDHMIVRATWSGGRSETRQPVAARTVPPIDHTDPNYQGLIVTHGRLYRHDLDFWPDFARSYQGLGFNTAMLRNAPPGYAAELRQAGLKIEVWLGPWDYKRQREQGVAEYRCQYKGNELPQGSKAGTHCPAYRGQLFHGDLKRMATQCAEDKPDYVFVDFEKWRWDGPECETCTRCNARKKALGIKTWSEYKVQMGLQIWAALRGNIVAAVTAAGGKTPKFSFYDVADVEPYQKVWDFAQLHKEGLDYAAPSLYCAIDGGAVKQLRSYLTSMGMRLGYANITPWLCPGDCGEYDSANLEEVLLWCYRKGMPGAHYWSERSWAGDDVIAQARAIQRFLETAKEAETKIETRKSEISAALHCH